MKLGTRHLIPVLLGICLVLGGCKQSLPEIQFDDVVSKVITTDSAIFAIGNKGYYFLSGKMVLVGGEVKEGECSLIAPPYLAKYKIKDLIDKYPEYLNKDIEAAIARQGK